MFDIIDTKAFKDSVHGYINIPRIFVKELIDTDYFQRLRNIDQTGMRILYPDAKHDRYGHSLGVFYLGCKAVDAMLNNFSQNPYWQVSSIKTENYRFWAKNKILFLIACLLHDVGHAPFSHSLENLFETASGTVRDTFINRIKKLEECYKSEWGDDEYNEECENLITRESAAHEMMGALLILEEGDETLRAHIKKIFDYLIAERFPRPQQDDILYAEHHTYDATVTQITDDDLCFIARMITGIKYKNYRPKWQIRNCFIELLNGSIFDVDQLDYIMRDTQMSGINNISIDVERLLNSINIVHSVAYRDCMVESLKCENRTITNLVFGGEGAPDDRGMVLTGEIAGRLCIPIGYKVSITKFEIKDSEGNIAKTLQSSFQRFSGKKDYVESVDITLCDTLKEVKFNKSTILYCGGNLISGEEDIRLNQSQGSYYIENAVVEDPKGFIFTLSDNHSQHKQNENHDEVIVSNESDQAEKGHKAYLDLRGFCNIKIEKLGYNTIPVRLDGNMRLQAANLSGFFSELTVLNEDLREPSKKGKYIMLSVGYHKQAMNIIANVIEARNYLYMWIYAHHKVVYYANFLLPSVADGLTTIEPQEGSVIPQTRLLYENLRYLDDSYLWTLVRRNGLSIPEDGEHGDLKKLCEELVGRRYMSSLFKSFAEFDLLFALYSDKQVNDFHVNIFKKIDEKRPRLFNKGNQNLAGYLNKESIEKINECLKSSIGKNDKGNRIKTVVIVRAQYKEKYLNRNATYIVMRDEVVTMDQIPSLHKKRVSAGDRDRYFYVYYDIDQSDTTFTQTDKKEFKEAVKKAFKEFFDEVAQQPSD